MSKSELSYEDKELLLQEAIARHPGEFTLADPAVNGKRFCVVPGACLWSELDNAPNLYVYIWYDDKGWMSYSRQTEAKLIQYKRPLEAPPECKSWKCEVRERRDLKWSSNALRFATKEECQQYGVDLFMRWMTLDKWQATPSDDEPTHKWERGEGVVKIDG